MATTTIAVSTPGKVLVSGGYVVLNGGHSLVLSTSSRFHSTISATHSASSTTVEPAISFKILVNSPQFSKSWKYSSTWSPASGHVPNDFTFKDTTESPSSGNIYVESALLYCLATAATHPETSKILPGHYELSITIQADNDFYSHSKALKAQGIVPTQENLSKLENFAVLGSSIAKTGLGSSAALVSSLTATFLTWSFGWSTQSDLENHLNLVHNVAQVAHCQAQGKIGSGFDVSAALFGSQHYVKFNANALNGIMTLYSTAKTAMTGLTSFLETLRREIGGNWLTHKPKSIALPRGLSMVLGECGKDMNTPTSVRQVLAWADAKPTESKELFQKLDLNNKRIIDLLTELTSVSEKESESYDLTLHGCSKVAATEWETVVEKSSTLDLLCSIRDAFQLQRSLMQTLGKETTTPIEPEEITRVLNGTQKLAGVLGVGAPGAGGYDAVYAIMVDRSAFPLVEQTWLTWEELPISCLLSHEDGRGAILKQ